VIHVIGADAGRIAAARARFSDSHFLIKIGVICILSRLLLVTSNVTCKFTGMSGRCRGNLFQRAMTKALFTKNPVKLSLSAEFFAFTVPPTDESLLVVFSFRALCSVYTLARFARLQTAGAMEATAPGP